MEPHAGPPASTDELARGRALLALDLPFQVVAMLAVIGVLDFQETWRLAGLAQADLARSKNLA